jgi:endonuclease/exonuclease/phosphatase family metal-dependent hydrolase
MPSFPKPKFDYDYQVASQIEAVRQYRDEKPGRQVPARQPGRLLLATWNIANLGLQQRRDKDYRLIAEILSWFDLIAVQEVHDNTAGVRGIHQHLPGSYRLLFSDIAGNKERMAFVYDTTKVAQLEKVGEVSVPPADFPQIKLPGIQRKFDGFDRNPYIVAFQAGTFRFQVVNVHLFYGSEKPADIERRSLETYAVARWCDLRRKSKYVYASDIIAIGDFNLPKTVPGDAIYDALTKRGLQLPQHSSEVGSSIASDNHYDQIAFFPGETEQEFTDNTGVFDFDGAVFKTLWEDRGRKDFLTYVRYFLSDHRPLWAEFAI